MLVLSSLKVSLTVIESIFMEIMNIPDRGSLGFSVSYERKEINRSENENSILMLHQIHDIARHHQLLWIICILEHLSVST